MNYLPRLKSIYAQKHTIDIVMIAKSVAQKNAVFADTLPLIWAPVSDATTSLSVV